MFLGYIGPGAGIALLGSFVAALSAVVSGAFFIVTYPIRLTWRTIRCGRVFARAKAKRVVILGLDGLEPELTEKFMDEGLLPNLAALRDAGGYQRLGTTYPPLSPVAWSSFSTGTNPGKHNIFDFISRNRADYRPQQSSVSISDRNRSLRIGRWVLPLSSPTITGRRRSRPFWSVLGESGIFSAVLRVPITFPPDRFHGVQLSAMCVPDIRGTHGTFSFYMEDGQEGTPDTGVGGDVVRVKRNGDEVRGEIKGPVNTLRSDRPEITVPFRVVRDRRGRITLHLQKHRIVLEPGQYTDWLRVSFRTIGPLRVHGLCRFLLKQFEPFELYCTPVQIDPDRPVMPIGHPRSYTKYLSRLHGDFATLGLAEDTWALSEGRIDEDDFLGQAYAIHDERERMFFDSIERVRRGLVVCVFDAPDRIQHMFWRFQDPGHPACPNGSNGSANGHREAHKDKIREMYCRMDELVGRTRKAVGDDTVLLVMSDHGFKSFRRGVDLNAWLRDNGYLFLKDDRRTSDHAYLGDVDWSRTRAYGLGLAGLYINKRGREGNGIVEPGDADTLVKEICDKLTGLRDETHDAVAVHRAEPAVKVYRGPYVDGAPDIIVGYSVGYRVSWDAVVGRTGDEVLTDNTKAWSGDHCLHPDLVPGVLFSTRKLQDAASIIDLAPTTLDLFGLTTPKYMDGKSLLCPAPSP